MFANARKVSLAMAAVLTMLLGVLAIPAQTSAAATVLTDEITTSEGTTDMLGGGSYFFVKFGPDALFGIVWGDDQTENNVYFVTVKARYLGFAQIYDRDGELVEGNHSVKIYTMYAVKLDSMLEFNDVNDDGALDYARAYDNDTARFTNYAATEPLYKKVDLSTSWTDTPVETVDDGDVKSWEFGLTASNLTYDLLDDRANETVGDGVLNNLTLTFHLEASAMQVDAEMPQWRITVTTGPAGKMWFYDAQKLANLQVNGEVAKYDVKWDQTIEGWDYDPANTDPMLLMEMSTLAGNFYPLAWMEARMLQHMNQVTVMNCASVEGNLTVNETTGDLEKPKQLIQTKLTFSAGWTYVGNLTWVDDVTVDGVPEQVKAQVMSAHRIWAVGENGRLFAGFVALTGLVFPGGDLIVHDPTFSSEALVNIGDEDSPLPGTMLLLAAAIIVVVVVAVAAASLGGKKPGVGAKNSYEKTQSSQPGAWAKYYQKK